MKRILLLTLLCFAAVSNAQKSAKKNANDEVFKQKQFIYQIVPRVYGNKNTNSKPNGSIDENGVGKFKDINDVALQQIRDLGATYVWYTGILQHSSLNDYKVAGISMDDPDVVKGRAGNLFAIKDYYNVDPDLADDQKKRLDEFDALILRTHKNGLKVIIDIIPNYVARSYKSTSASKKRPDFGANDDSSVAYMRDNNFYYAPDSAFSLPDRKSDSQNGHAKADGKFDEKPARWSANGTASERFPTETFDIVKLNFGVNPDGSNDFPELPPNFEMQPAQAHYDFWKDKSVPDTWKKFRDIASYWMDRGVDGFRFAHADDVPAEFWSYLNSALKIKNPDVLLLGQIADANKYRRYIRFGKFDYIYDNNGLYAKQLQILQRNANPDPLVYELKTNEDIADKMVNFIENHDLKRIASTDFGGNGHKAKPLMTIAATISSSPTMIYFGQEVGEQAKSAAGFGPASQTSLYDYTNAPNHQRWMNDGKFDGGKLKFEEKTLRDFYQRLLRFSAQSSAMTGDYEQLQLANKDSKGYDEDIFSFVRFSDDEKLLIIVNYSDSKSSYFDLKIPPATILKMKLKDGSYIVKDQLYGKSTLKLNVAKGHGNVTITIAPSESFIYKIQ